MNQPKIAAETVEDELPFDKRTVGLSLLRRWPWFLLIGFVACVIGLVVGLSLGARSYRADTVLLYRPEPELASGITPLTLPNQVGMVHLDANLERAHAALPDVSIRRLRFDTDATVRRDSQFLTITGRSENPETAANMANALRDAFLEGQRQVRRAQLVEWIAELEDRRGRAAIQLEAARSSLAAFLSVNGFQSPQMDIESFFARLDAIDQATSSLEAREASVRALMSSTEAMIAAGGSEEGWDPSADLSGLSLAELQMKITFLEAAIEDDRSYQTNRALLAERELEVERQRSLVEVGIMAQSVLDAAVAAAERQRILTEESDDVREVKAQLRAVQAALLRAAGDPTGRDLEQRLVDARFDHSTTERELIQLREERRELTRDKKDLLELQREHAALLLEVEQLEGEIRSGGEMLSAARREHASPSSEFTLLSVARAPIEAEGSNRKPLAAGTAAVLAFLGLCGVLGVETFQVVTKIRSGRELTRRLPLRFLGSLPAVDEDEVLAAANDDDPMMERARLIARRVRHAVSKDGARFLVTSAVRGAGHTTVALCLARSLGEQGERVLLVNADPRGNWGPEVLQALVSPETDSLVGGPEPTRWPGVFLVRPSPDEGPAVGPARRMRHLLDELAPKSGVAIIDGPPVLEGVAADLIAEHVDGIVIVARAGVTPVEKLRKAHERLETFDLPITGVVLNGVEEIFLEDD